MKKLLLIGLLLFSSCQPDEIDTILDEPTAEYKIESIDVSRSLTGKNNNIVLDINGSKSVGTYVKEFEVAYTDTGLAVYSRQYNIETEFGAKRLVVNLFVDNKFNLQFGEFFFDNGEHIIEGTTGASADKWLAIRVTGSIRVEGSTGILENGEGEIFDNSFTTQSGSIPFSFELSVQ